MAATYSVYGTYADATVSKVSAQQTRINYNYNNTGSYTLPTLRFTGQYMSYLKYNSTYIMSGRSNNYIISAIYFSKRNNLTKYTVSETHPAMVNNVDGTVTEYYTFSIDNTRISITSSETFKPAQYYVTFTGTGQEFSNTSTYYIGWTARTYYYGTYTTYWRW